MRERKAPKRRLLSTSAEALPTTLESQTDSLASRVQFWPWSGRSTKSSAKQNDAQENHAKGKQCREVLYVTGPAKDNCRAMPVYSGCDSGLGGRQVDEGVVEGSVAPGSWTLPHRMHRIVSLAQSSCP